MRDVDLVIDLVRDPARAGLDTGALRVLVEDGFPVRDAAGAHEVAELRRALGKFVLVV